MSLAHHHHHHHRGLPIIGRLRSVYLSAFSPSLSAWPGHRHGVFLPVWDSRRQGRLPHDGPRGVHPGECRLRHVSLLAGARDRRPSQRCPRLCVGSFWTRRAPRTTPSSPSMRASPSSLSTRSTASGTSTGARAAVGTRRKGRGARLGGRRTKPILRVRVDSRGDGSSRRECHRDCLLRQPQRPTQRRPPFPRLRQLCAGRLARTPELAPRRPRRARQRGGGARRNRLLWPLIPGPQTAGQQSRLPLLTETLFASPCVDF